MPVRTPAAGRNAETRQRLLSAALIVIEREGSIGLTARRLASESGCGVSAMNYAFGSREQLLEATFREATALAARRWEQRIAQLPATNIDRATVGWLAFALQSTLQDRSYPRLALIELFQLAARDERLREIAFQHRQRMEHVWSDVVARTGLPGSAKETLSWFAESAASTHVWASNWAVTTPWLTDCIDRLIARLRGGRRALPGWEGWSNLKASELGQAPAIEKKRGASEAAERMLAAAAQLIARDGLNVVTHRAVAAAADCTLANVAYHFPSRDALLEATFKHIFFSVIERGAVDDQTLHDHSATSASLAKDVAELVIDRAGNVAANVMAVRELMLAAERDSRLSNLAARLILDAEAANHRSLAALDPTGDAPDRLDAQIAMLTTEGARQAACSMPRRARRQFLRGCIERSVSALFSA